MTKMQAHKIVLGETMTTICPTCTRIPLIFHKNKYGIQISKCSNRDCGIWYTLCPACNKILILYHIPRLQIFYVNCQCGKKIEYPSSVEARKNIACFQCAFQCDDCTFTVPIVINDVTGEPFADCPKCYKHYFSDQIDWRKVTIKRVRKSDFGNQNDKDTGT